MPPIGSGLLPGDNYPDWLTFNGNGSSVTFEVPQVDGRNLKTIMCIVNSSSPDNITSEGLKVVMVINCTKNTILLCKRDALLASWLSDEEEYWQRVVSNAEPGDKVKVIVVFGNKFTVKKTTVYFIYDEPIDEETKEETEHYLEPNENINVSSGNDNIGDPKKKTNVSKGKKIHIDPCAEEDWSDGDQEKKPSKRKTSNFAEPSKSKTHENSKKEESPRTFEHLKPDDSKADSESEALTLTKAPTSKEDLPPPSKRVKTEIKGETQKPALPERIRIKSLDSKSSSSPLPETPQKPASNKVLEKNPLSNQVDPMEVDTQGNDFDGASNVLNQEQEVETNLGFEEHQEKPQEEHPKKKLEGSTKSSPTKGPNEEKAPVSDPSYTPLSSGLPDFEELLAIDPATAMDKLLAGEFSHSSKTEQASSEPTSSHTSSNVLNAELQKLKKLVLQKKFLSLLLNDQEMKTEVNTLIDSIEAKLKDLTIEQYAGFIKFSKLFKTAITNIDASLKNKQQLMNTETEAKDATARLVVARKDMDRYKESITAGNKKLEEWNTEIPKIEAELQRIKEKLEHAKQEKNMLESLHPKLVEKQTEVLEGAKKLSKTVFTLQEKVAQYKQKEKELESEYVEFEANFKQLKDDFPF